MDGTEETAQPVVTVIDRRRWKRDTNRTRPLPPIPTARSEATAVQESVGDLHDFVDLFDTVRDRRVWGLWLLITLNVADIVTTVWFLTTGATEGNPLLAPVVSHWWAIVGIKLAVLAFVVRGVLAAPTRSREARRFMVLALTYYSLVVCWNVYVALR